MVVLDGSASIQSSDWQKALKFTNTLISGFNISADQVEVGVVQFSSQADIVINLSSDPVAIAAAVSNLNQMKRSTNTHSGFQEAKTMLDTHGRPNTAGKLVILLTDGVQNGSAPRLPHTRRCSLTQTPDPTQRPTSATASLLLCDHPPTHLPLRPPHPLPPSSLSTRTQRGCLQS